MSICLLNHTQVRKWEETGKRPPCAFHHHISFTKARQMVGSDEAVDMLMSRAIIVYPCVERYTWRGSSSIGYQVMQMVPIK